MKCVNLKRTSIVLLVFAFVLTTSALAAGPQLIWATYYGNGIFEATEAIAIGPDGTIYATGFIQPPDWNIDIFVARYSADGTQLLNHTVIDGGGIDSGFSIAVDEAGTVTVGGQTMSADFPVTENAVQGTYGGGMADGLLLQLNSDFEVTYASFFGGYGEESIVDMAVDDSGALVITGYTGGNLPVTEGAYQTIFGGGNVDAFVAKIDPTAETQLLYSTYLGGSGNDTEYDPNNVFGTIDERLLRQAVDTMPDGRIVVSGMTSSTDFPITPGAIQTAHAPLNNPAGYSFDDADIYLSVLDPAAVGTAQLAYSTYLGGTGRDLTDDLVVRGDDKIILAGHSQSTGFPVSANAYQGALNPGATRNVVVAQLRPDTGLSTTEQLAHVCHLRS